jgi:hypothetical protein
VKALRQSTGLGKVAAAVWVAVFIGVCLRLTHQPQRNNLLPTYRLAGAHWLNSEALYQGERGFIYSPPIAAAMVPLALLPESVADVLWRLISAAALFAALAWWKNSGLPPQHDWPKVLILLAILSLGNLNNGQANLLLLALLVAAAAAVKSRSWALAACFFSLATYFKIYPLALALLFVAIYPRQLGYRLLIALIAVAGFAFLLQRPNYVLAQYSSWMAARLHERRHLWDEMNAPQDLWRALKLTGMSELVYHAIQAASGLALVWLALTGRRHRWTEERLISSLFLLGSTWLVLFGPATESATYLLLAPALVFAALAAVGERFPILLRTWICIVLLTQLAALFVISFTSWRHSNLVLLQPIGAALLLIYLLVWANSASLWPAGSGSGMGRS